MWFPFLSNTLNDEVARENIFINNILCWGVRIFHNRHVTCQKRNIWLLCKYKTSYILYHHAHPLHTFWLYFIICLTERTHDCNNKMRSCKKVHSRHGNRKEEYIHEVCIFQMLIIFTLWLQIPFFTVYDMYLWNIYLMLILCSYCLWGIGDKGFAISKCLTLSSLLNAVQLLIHILFNFVTMLLSIHVSDIDDDVTAVERCIGISLINFVKMTEYDLLIIL